MQRGVTNPDFNSISTTYLAVNAFDFGCFIEVLEVFTSTKVPQKY